MQQNRIVTRGAQLRATTPDLIESRQVEFVISSEAVDNHDTVFKMDGWDLTRYANNPIVCYQHRSYSNDPDDIIGVSEVFKEGDKLIGRVTFESADINPKAEKIFNKVVAGTLKMASVGAQVTKARFGDEDAGENPETIYFLEQQLIEWSIVSAGSNPDALKRNEQTITEMRGDLVAQNLELINKNKPAITIKSVHEAQVIINKNK